MHVHVSDPFRQGKGLIYHVEIKFKDPITRKDRHTKRTTKESDYRRAVKKKGEIEEAFRQKLATVHKRNTPQQSLLDFGKQYFETCEVGAKTKEDYEYEWQRFVGFTGNDTCLADVDRDIILRHRMTIVGKHSQAKSHRTLSAIFAKAVRSGKLKYNPFNQVDPPKTPQNLPDSFQNDAEFLTFVNGAPIGTYCQRMIKWATVVDNETGMRSGEISNLRVTDLNFEDKVFQILNTETFTLKRLRERVNILNERVAFAIKEQLKNKANHSDQRVRESEYIFCNDEGGVYEDSAIGKKFRELRMLMLPDRRRLHFHSLRHSFAMHSLNMGLPMREIAFHMGESESCCEKTYARLVKYNPTLGAPRFKYMRDYLLSRSADVFDPNPPAKHRIMENP
jgi:integrase